MADFTNFGYNDVCSNVYILLNCDGTINEAHDPLVFCGLSSITRRQTVNEATETERDSAQTGKPAFKRRVAASLSKRYIDITTTGLENVKLLSWLDLAAPVVDPITGDYLGFEAPSGAAASQCSSCGRESGASCAHKIAIITTHNAWVGEDRHCVKPYVANIYPSVLIEPAESEMEFSLEFTAERNFSGELQDNPSFIDPWGIDPRGASSVDYKTLGFDAPEGSSLGDLLDSACGCGACDNITIGEQLGELALA